MPKKGYKNHKQIDLSFPSPLKNRSSFVRKAVRWSPQVELQDAINTANINLDRMSDDPYPFISRTKCDRTPVSKVPPQ